MFQNVLHHLKTQQQWTFRSQICPLASMVAERLQKLKFLFYVLYLCYISFILIIFFIFILCFYVSSYVLYMNVTVKISYYKNNICILMIRIFYVI